MIVSKGTYHPTGGHIWGFSVFDNFLAMGDGRKSVRTIPTFPYCYKCGCEKTVKLHAIMVHYSTNKVMENCYASISYIRTGRFRQFLTFWAILTHVKLSDPLVHEAHCHWFWTESGHRSSMRHSVAWRCSYESLAHAWRAGLIAA